MYMAKGLKEINELIARIKQKTGMNQDDIARRIGYNRSYISQAKKTDSEKLFQALYLGFKSELENITKDEETQTTKDVGSEPLEKAILNMSETDKINARNIERLINLLELKFKAGMELPTKGTPGTINLMDKKKKTSR